jgi:ketosteroid isomerase-like protein
MSQDNVEVVRRMIEVFNRRDLKALEDLSREDLEIESALTAANLGASSYRGGVAAWPRYFADMDETFENWGIEQDFRLLDAGKDRVACLCSLAGDGRSSGARVTRSVGIIFTLRDGRAWRIRSYLDPAEALEAVGLSE